MIYSVGGINIGPETHSGHVLLWAEGPPPIFFTGLCACMTAIWSPAGAMFFWAKVEQPAQQKSLTSCAWVLRGRGEGCSTQGRRHINPYLVHVPSLEDILAPQKICHVSYFF